MEKPMEIRDIVENLKENRCNYLDYFASDGKRSKPFAEIFIDVVKVLDYLRTRNIAKGDRIGIFAFNSYEWIVLDLACFIGGYINVAFSINNFAAELPKLSSEFGLKVLIEEDRFITGIKDVENVIPISDISKCVNNGEDAPDDISALINIPDSEQIFTIIFTSGTTSTPKALEIKVNAVEDYVRCMGKLFPTDTGDKIMLYLPFWSFPQRLYVYAAVLLKFNMVLTRLETITKALSREKPTIFQGIPYFFESIYQLFSSNMGFNKEDFVGFWGGKIKYLITGSAPINRHVLEFYHNNGLMLFETYGLTETGVTTINHHGAYKIGSVGKVVEDKEVAITDEGEILVRGKYCWGRSYLNDTTGLNEKVFRSDGYIATGDVGYFDEDGFLYITGRIKEMVVLSNGHKYHPRPAEEELCNSGLIAQAAIFGDGLPYLAAVVVKSNRNVSADMIKECISNVNERLPEYAKIKAYCIAKEPFTMENGMLTSSVKLNRKFIYQAYKDEILKA